MTAQGGLSDGQDKHIAIATQDAEKTARFYREVIDLKEASKIDGANAFGYYLTDGNVNLAILDFKNDQVTGPVYCSDCFSKQRTSARSSW